MPEGQAMKNMDRLGYIGLAAVILLAMAAGAALYHQYMMLEEHPAEKARPEVEAEYISEEPVRTRNISEPEPAPEPVTQEELEEEMYYDSLELLACCVEAEAGNQSLLGKRMVADVILNRVDDKDFPDTIEGVITEPYRFTSWWNGAMEKAVPSEETYVAVRMELDRRGWPGLLYFTAGGYPEYGTPWKRIGDHYFSTK